MKSRLLSDLTAHDLFTLAIYCAHHGYNGGEQTRSCNCPDFTGCRESASTQAARLLEYLALVEVEPS